MWHEALGLATSWQGHLASGVPLRRSAISLLPPTQVATNRTVRPETSATVSRPAARPARAPGSTGPGCPARARAAPRRSPPCRIWRKTRQMPSSEARFSRPMTIRKVPEMLVPHSPVHCCSLESWFSRFAASVRTSKAGSATRMNTTLEWPSANQKPTVCTLCLPFSATNFRVVLSIAAMWSASKDCWTNRSCNGTSHATYRSVGFRADRQTVASARQISNRHYVEFGHTASTPVLGCCAGVFRRRLGRA